MRVLFKSIKLQNFMSYQEGEVSLDRHGFILVSGVNNNPVDNAKSNGTGKSSLFSAISWALTGMTVNGGKEVANIYLPGITFVELIFEVDGVEYKVYRTKNPSGLKLYVNGDDKSGKGIRDTEKILSEYLPSLTHVLLNSVIILGQGLPQKFTNNTPSGRKEVLENLSNSDFMIADLKTRVVSRTTTLKNLLREEEDNITSASAKEELLTETIEKLTAELAQYDDEQYNILQNKLLNKNNSIKEYQNKIDTSDKIINATLLDIKNVNDVLTKNFDIYTQEKNKLELKDVTGIAYEIMKCESSIDTLQNEIKKLDSVVDICPTCGQKLPNVTKIDTTDKKHDLFNLNVRLYELQIQQQQNIDYNDNITAKFKLEFDLSQQNTKQQLDSLTLKLDNENSIKNDNLAALTDIQTQLKNIELQINDFTKKKQELTTNLENYTAQLDVLQKKIMCYNDNVKTLKMHLDVVSKMSTMLTRDFRGYLLQNVIEYISRQAKQYAIDLFNSDKLEFKLDGNNIDITYDSKDYEVLSGGEKQKIDVIIQFSIRDMLCTYLNFSSNILILDEITDSLDIIGSQKMFNLIANKLNDVEAIYIISHHQDDFEIPYDDKINIVKGNDKISRILP